MPWFLHINLGFKCYINLYLWRSFTFYNDVIYNKIRWCKICPNLLWMMRPNVVALVGHISGLRFSCTFSFTFCWISPIASMQRTRIVWLDCKHHKILKFPKNPLNIGLGILFGFCDKNVCDMTILWPPNLPYPNLRHHHQWIVELHKL